MTIFVTGGSGFVGLNLLEQLLGRGEHVVSFSLEAPPERAGALFESLPGTFRHAAGDVRDAHGVAEALADSGAMRVIHGAVITAGMERERRDPGSIVATNVAGTVNVLEAARRKGVDRFVFLSSASVYGANALGGDTLSEADTVTITVPLTSEPSTGFVTVAVGGVVSALLTVTVTWSEPTFPAAS